MRIPTRVSSATVQTSKETSAKDETKGATEFMNHQHIKGTVARFLYLVQGPVLHHFCSAALRGPFLDVPHGNRAGWGRSLTTLFGTISIGEALFILGHIAT